MSSDVTIQKVWLERKWIQAHEAGARGDLNTAIGLGLEVLALKKSLKTLQENDSQTAA